MTLIKCKKCSGKKIAIIASAIVCAVIAFIILLNTVIIPNGKYNEASALEETNPTEAAMAFGKLGDYRDAQERSFALWDRIAVRETISAGDHHTVGLKADGTVVAAGSNYYGKCNVSGWTDIVAISAGSYHTVGLRADGTVVAVGYNGGGQCNVFGWRLKTK